MTECFSFSEIELSQKQERNKVHNDTKLVAKTNTSCCHDTQQDFLYTTDKGNDG